MRSRFVLSGMLSVALIQAAPRGLHAAQFPGEGPGAAKGESTNVQERGAGDTSETFAHVCVFVRATYAQKIIQELLMSRRPAKGGGQFAPPQMVRISTDQRTNTVFVSGAAEHIAQAKAVLTKIDVAAQGSPRLALGPHLLKTYNVAAGNARAVAEALQRIFRGETDVEITALSNNQILVWADPEDQLAVARHLVELQPAPLATEVIVLSTLPPAKTAETLRSMFGAARTGGGGVPFIEADPARNALIVKASKEQLDDIRATLRSLGEGAPAGSTRTFNVERGDAASLAEALERLLKDVRSNPVRVIMPEQKAGPAMKGKDKGSTPKKDTSKVAGEITMTVLGNKLIVACDDPQALALAQELVRMLTSASDAEGKFEVIKLRHAKAADIALVLDKAFNGAGKGTPERVQIVADAATNALLIKAGPLDQLTVRRLLSSALDAEEADAAALPGIRIIGPLKHAKAREVVNILRDIFGARPDDKAASAPAKGVPRFSVDERTNSIVVQCSPALEVQIEALVTRLDGKE
jgi:type II secretory pathway component GspD/PulD (secretin)